MRLRPVVSIVVLAVAVVLLVVVLAMPRVSLPVVAELGGGRQLIAQLDLGVAVVVLCGLGGVLLLIPSASVVGRPATRVGRSAPVVGRSASVVGRSAPVVGRSATAVGQSAPVVGQSATVVGRSATVVGQSLALVGRSVSLVGRSVALIGHTVALVGHSITLSATVFLVARMNGIADVASLVPLYALTSAMVLSVVFQSRIVVRSGHPLLALCFGAGVGIAPWGVIAFVQIGGIVVGEGPPMIVRVITLVALSGAVLWFLAVWRVFRRDSPAGSTGPDLVGLPGVLSAATSGVFAIVVVAGVVSPQIVMPG